jgi:hypothetical protein
VRDLLRRAVQDRLGLLQIAQRDVGPHHAAIGRSVVGAPLLQNGGKMSGRRRSPRPRQHLLGSLGRFLQRVGFAVAAAGLDHAVDERLDLGAGHRALEAVDRLALVEGEYGRDRLDLQLRRDALASSTLTLTIFTAPRAARTASSSIGPSVLQGPHQGAQKSTITGVFIDASTTSAMNVCSVPSLMRSASAGFAALRLSSTMVSILRSGPICAVIWTEWRQVPRAAAQRSKLAKTGA